MNRVSLTRAALEPQLARLRNDHHTWRDTIARCEEAADLIEALLNSRQAVVDAATALVKEVCERHDSKNPPYKYLAPYGAVVTLAEVIKAETE
jgi:hypothetical protein